MSGSVRTSDDMILTVLETAKDYVSGECLSRKLGLSRTAVWKRVQVLRGMGYEIGARPHRGYILTQKPELLMPLEIGRLKTCGIAKDIRSFKEVASTNELAYKMALEGASEGVVVISETQTQGRGRMRRRWVSPPGRNIYLSLILRPRITPRLAPLLTYVGAVSTAEALDKGFALDVSLKWPNDVLVRSKKLAGLLNEVKAETDRVDFIVLGFGINVNMEKEDFPEDLRQKATSVMIELGRKVSRVEVIQCLLESIETWYDVFLLHGADPVIRQWESLARIRGTSIEVRSFDDTCRGVVEGVDRDGALMLRQEKDRIIRLVAGDVIGKVRRIRDQSS